MSGAGRLAVLLDLDGTLTDPFEGITSSIRYALERLGCAVPAAEDLKWCIGPPLLSSFRVLLETDDDAALHEAIRLYRERYSTVGKLENRVIDGVPEVLGALKREGYFLSIATSKPTTYTIDILEHFGLRAFFDAVHGAEMNGRNAQKSDLIRFILEAERLQATETVMVGDRMHDVAGAAANDVAAIGVLWGYGSREDLEKAGAAAIAAEPGELVGLVKRILNPA